MLINKVKSKILENNSKILFSICMWISSAKAELIHNKLINFYYK